jgi:hypothetical protein
MPTALHHVVGVDLTPTSASQLMGLQRHIVVTFDNDDAKQTVAVSIAIHVPIAMLCRRWHWTYNPINQRGCCADCFLSTVDI